MILSYVYLLYTSLLFLSSNGITQTFFLVTSLLFAIYTSGRFYGEVKASKDFIEISSHGIKYRETPGIYQGWLPVENEMKFDEIKTTDVVKIKNIFNPNSENMAIYLIPITGKPKIIGTKLNQKQITKIGLAMKGSVVLSNALQRLIGDDSTVSDVVDTAKELWKSFKSKGE